MSEKMFQVRLWLTAVLGSIVLFIVTERIWKEVPDIFLLLYLVVGLLINLFISKIRKMKLEEKGIVD